jgi:hypothetical protein
MAQPLTDDWGAGDKPVATGVDDWGHGDQLVTPIKDQPSALSRFADQVGPIGLIHALFKPSDDPNEHPLNTFGKNAIAIVKSMGETGSGHDAAESLKKGDYAEAFRHLGLGSMGPGGQIVDHAIDLFKKGDAAGGAGALTNIALLAAGPATDAAAASPTMRGAAAAAAEIPGSVAENVNILHPLRVIPKVIEDASGAAAKEQRAAGRIPLWERAGAQAEVGPPPMPVQPIPADLPPRQNYPQMAPPGYKPPVPARVPLWEQAGTQGQTNVAPLPVEPIPANLPPRINSAQPQAPAAVAPGIDEVLLDQIAKGMGGKKFSQLGPAGQEAVKLMANRVSQAEQPVAAAVSPAPSEAGAGTSTAAPSPVEIPQNPTAGSEVDRLLETLRGKTSPARPVRPPGVPVDPMMGGGPRTMYPESRPIRIVDPEDMANHSNTFEEGMTAARYNLASKAAKMMIDKGVTSESLDAIEANPEAAKLFWDNLAKQPGISKQAKYSEMSPATKKATINFFKTLEGERQQMAK